jgi:hypothetical protein
MATEQKLHWTQRFGSVSNRKLVIIIAIGMTTILLMVILLKQPLIKLVGSLWLTIFTVNAIVLLICKKRPGNKEAK